MKESGDRVISGSGKTEGGAEERRSEQEKGNMYNKTTNAQREPCKTLVGIRGSARVRGDWNGGRTSMQILLV